MILGDVCSRGCAFCNITRGEPSGVDLQEADCVAEAVAVLGLTYAVITSVTRDDLADGGARLFAETIRAVRRRSPDCKIEVLIPDFQGADDPLMTVLQAKPDVLNHNIETVPGLYGRIRPRAVYERSLRILGTAKQSGFTTKTGIMLGLGETMEDLYSLMQDLRGAGCDRMTVGQYLQPNRAALPVARYYQPEEFERIRVDCLAMGFERVQAGPLVRSSYHAEAMACA